MPNSKVVRFKQPTKQVTVYKDENLIPENIRSGKTIEGVVGTLEVPTIADKYQLDMNNVTYDSAGLGTLTMTNPPKQIVVAKDKDLEPENIKKGITIEGIEGTLESGGGGGVFNTKLLNSYTLTTNSSVPNYQFSFYDLAITLELYDINGNRIENASIPVIQITNSTKNALYYSFTSLMISNNLFHPGYVTAEGNPTANGNYKTFEIDYVLSDVYMKESFKTHTISSSASSPTRFSSSSYTGISSFKNSDSPAINTTIPNNSNCKYKLMYIKYELFSAQNPSQPTQIVSNYTINLYTQQVIDD